MAEIDANQYALPDALDSGESIQQRYDKDTELCVM